MYAFLSIGLFSAFILLGLNFERKLERQKASRKERRPFNLDVKLLRRPGEGLLTEIEKLGKEITIKIFFICYLGAASAAIIGIATPILPHGLFWQLGVIGTALLLYAIFGVRSFRGLLLLIEKRDRYYLGYFGECSVAEYLDELKHDGHFVFHDIPAKSTRYNFNIDHVVVGPTGLFAIETKTRSKYWPREAKIKEKIEFDGERLIFTGGPDTSHIEQAARQADWLASYFGNKVEVQPILTFPGWQVIERVVGPVWVLYPGGLATAVRRRSGQSLSKEEIEVIRSRLTDLCRDVEY